MFGQYELLTDRNTRNNLVWTIETGTCKRCVSYTGYFAHEKNKGEARGRNNNNNKRVVRNREENKGHDRVGKPQTRHN